METLLCPRCGHELAQTLGVFALPAPKDVFCMAVLMGDSQIRICCPECGEKSAWLLTCTKTVAVRAREGE